MSLTTVTAYDGLNRKIAATDRVGNMTRYVYSTTGTLQNVIAADDSCTTYTYDFRGRLVKSTDQRDNSTEYTYDIQGRTLTETNLCPNSLYPNSIS